MNSKVTVQIDQKSIEKKLMNWCHFKAGQKNWLSHSATHKIENFKYELSIIAQRANGKHLSHDFHVSDKK